MSAREMIAAVAAALVVAFLVWRWRKLSLERKAIGILIALALGVYASGVLSARCPTRRRSSRTSLSRSARGRTRWSAVLAFLETGAFVGLVAPGETVVIAGGVIAGQGEIQLLPLIGLVWLCAVLGDTTSFYIGRRLGRRSSSATGRAEDHRGAAPAGRVLLRPPRRQDDPDRPLHRAGAGARAVHRRLLGPALPALYPVQHRRHRPLGDPSACSATSSGTRSTGSRRSPARRSSASG